VQTISELRIAVKRLGTATYVTRKGGIGFKSMLIFQTTVRVSTDRLLVSDEAVRVLDARE